MIRKCGKHCVRHLIKSHQLCIPWSPPLECEPATTEPKLYHKTTGPHQTQTKPNLSVMVNARPINLMCLIVTSVLLQRTWSPTGLCLAEKIGDKHPLNHNLMGKELYICCYMIPYNWFANVVRLLAERSDTKSNVKLGGFRCQLQAPYVSSHTGEFWYNESISLWMKIYTLLK